MKWHELLLFSRLTRELTV